MMNKIKLLTTRGGLIGGGRGNWALLELTDA